MADWTLLECIRLARADLSQYRRYILSLTFPSHKRKTVLLDWFFYFTYNKRLWDTELSGGPPFNKLCDLIHRLDHDRAQEWAAICQTVIATKPRIQENEEVQQYRQCVDM